MAIRKIRRESISEQVLQQMKEQILHGEWKQQEKIPSEHELAAMFGVSRVTIRNALQKLAAQGLVETRFGEGSFVRSADGAMVMNPLIQAAYLSTHGLEEILQYRRMIEGPVCEEACLCCSDEHFTQLQSLYENMKGSRSDLQQFAGYDYEFHMLLAGMTGNSLLIQTYTILNEIMKAAFDRIVQDRGNEAGLHYHGLLVEAFEHRNAAKARQIMEEHMKDLYTCYHSQSISADIIRADIVR